MSVESTPQYPPICADTNLAVQHVRNLAGLPAEMETTLGTSMICLRKESGIACGGTARVVKGRFKNLVRTTDAQGEPFSDHCPYAAAAIAESTIKDIIEHFGQ